MKIAGVELSQVNAILVEDLNAVGRWNVSKNANRTWLGDFLCQLQIRAWTSVDIAGGGLFVSLRASRTGGVRMIMRLSRRKQINNDYLVNR
jgi:hypothetical protein